MRLTLAFLLTSSLALSAGCDFYLGGGGDDDDDDVCDYGGGSLADRAAPRPDLRNPFTGQCEAWGYNDPWCDNACGPCTGTDSEGAPQEQPSWGMCDSYCTGLDEDTCVATTGCRGAYIEQGCPTELGACNPDPVNVFWECWSVDMTGPIQGGGCDGLDAWSCSVHDDCIAIHGNACDSGGGGIADPAALCLGDFQQCADERAGCYADYECGQDERCNANEVCQTPPDCQTGEGGAFIDCDAACYGWCVPEPPVDPGSCYGDVLCDLLEPACPADTVPGIANGCYTGYCIPIDECEAPPAACDTLTDEMDCIGRADCTGLYEGVDCTCDPNGCECNEWVFQSCDAA